MTYPTTSLPNADSITAPRADARATSEPTALSASVSDVSGEQTGATPLPWYRREAWLAMQLAALLPIVAAVFLPPGFRVLLAAVSGALLVVGLVMLFRRQAHVDAR